MAQALNRQGYVDDHFIQDVFQREHSYPTTFGSIAVPHSMKMDAIKTGLCVAISEKPFPWGDNMVNMALIFSINKAERAIFYDIFDNIIVLLLEPANLKKALECRSWKELIVTITSSF
ncbi:MULTISPECIES: PTS sugar transporter subunit IIA [unclassified Erwinia]|nr:MULTISPECIES: PTS sugar transporter subunit IIA [unclassified Erwinia]